MFKHLKEIDSKLYERYLTLERNIRSGSNSFYDAYLDLQEQFIKTVSILLNFDIRARESCGDLLKRNDVKDFFINTLRLDEYVYNKMQDYTLKVNAHKHKGEKAIQLETIINYMRIIHSATAAYAFYREIKVVEFDANFFIGIFSSFEKENAALKSEMNKLKEELRLSVESRKLKESDINLYKALLDQSEIEKFDLESQNNELHRQISVLKDIKLSSVESKLNKTIDLLNELTASVVENRAISYAVGDTICGAELFKSYVEKAKKDIKHE